MAGDALRRSVRRASGLVQTPQYLEIGLFPDCRLPRPWLEPAKNPDKAENRVRDE